MARWCIPGLDTLAGTASDMLNAAVEKGKQSRGAAADDGYKFGDVTRGLLSGTPRAEYAVWADDAEGEFGPSLHPKDFPSQPLSVASDGSATICEMVQRSVGRSSERMAVGKRQLVKIHKVEEGGKTFEKLELSNTFESLTYKQYMDRIEAFASGLVGLTGISAGGRMVVYAETQQDWMVAALSAFMMNIEVVTIYATLGEEGALHGLNQTRAAVCVVDSKLVKTLKNIAPQCEHLKHVITVAECSDDAKASLTDENAGRSVHTFETVCEKGRKEKLPARPPLPSAVAVVMYTSGTTGAPKGVQLSHANLIAAVAGFGHEAEKANITHDDVFLAYLPLAHIMEMIAEMAMLMLGGFLGYGSPHTLIESSVKLKRPESQGDANVFKPTFMVFAPAVFDKVYKGVLKKVESAGGMSKKLFDAALNWGTASYDAGSVGVNPVLNLAFKSVQEALGGRIRLAATGSAPLSPEIQRFMQTVLKAPVRQGYGLTENCACATLGAFHDNTVSSVGPPNACAVLRLADWPEGGYKNSDKDTEIGMPRGEVLVGGPTVCMGYLIDACNPDPDILKKNSEEFVTIQGIRYFRTGDIGQVVKNGTLQIIDRKKDLWKGPQGEYVSLSKVEAALKLSPFAEIPMAYGKTGADYPIALICISERAVKQISADFEAIPIDELCRNPDVVAKVMQSCKEVCKEAGLCDFEVPKKICLLPPKDGDSAWTPENDMLTAAMKLKRPQIVKAFAAEIAATYA